MKPNSNNFPTDPVIPPIKMKNSINRKRLVVSVVLTMTLASLTTTVLILLLALMFAPQLSNALWGTDLTQQALYGTSAAIHNAQVVVDMTSTALRIQANDQQNLLENIQQRESILDVREADLIATDEALNAAIVATQTAEVVSNALQRTQAAIHYNETQSAINQQSTVIAIEATSTQLALDTGDIPVPTLDTRPFDLVDDINYTRYSLIDCNWQGIAGTVYNADNQPISDNLQIRVLGEGLDMVVEIGDNLGLDETYNWAIKLSDNVNSGIYFLRLENTNGQALSPMVRVNYESLCSSNLARIDFIQTGE